LLLDGGRLVDPSANCEPFSDLSGRAGSGHEFISYSAGKAIGAIALQKEILVHTVLEPVAAFDYGDDFGVMEKSVEDGAGGRHVAKEFSPFFDGTIEVIRVKRFS
jgi:hypothetical protein